ncbi:MAG: PilZ domain-containing protein [Deltaproteobacteria bacterium]|nr:PilZ domain-containing protein [Deltaproteobacteria bacterium]
MESDTLPGNSRRYSRHTFADPLKVKVTSVTSAMTQDISQKGVSFQYKRKMEVGQSLEMWMMSKGVSVKGVVRVVVPLGRDEFRVGVEFQTPLGAYMELVDPDYKPAITEQDFRKYQRIEYRHPIYVKSEQWADATAADISFGGISFITADIMNPGDKLEVMLLGESISVEGSICSHLAHDEALYRVGVAFEHPQEDIVEVLLNNAGSFPSAG